jgi:hypothetical protein
MIFNPEWLKPNRQDMVWRGRAEEMYKIEISQKQHPTNKKGWQIIWKKRNRLL